MLLLLLPLDEELLEELPAVLLLQLEKDKLEKELLEDELQEELL